MHRNERLTLVASLLLWIAYFLCLMHSYPMYISAQRGHSVAMIDALFPYFNLITLSLSLLCFGCVIYKIENKFLHTLLLTQFSLILWLTPFYLSGFVLSHDTLYHGGVSLYAPEVLNGTHTYFSDYLENYPVSFIFNWIFLNIIAVDMPTYGRLIFPSLIGVATAILMYNFASKLFDGRIALISTFLAIIGLYYVEIQVSPQSIGVMLVLTTVSLLYRGDAKSKIGSILPILVLIPTHPVHPLLLTVFLIAPAISQRLTHTSSRYVPFGVSYTLLVAAGWLAWALFHSVTVGAMPFVHTIYKVAAFSFAVDPMEAVNPTKTLFPLFEFLRTYILYSYAAVLFAFTLTNLNLNRIRSIKGTYRHLTRAPGLKRVMIFTFIILFFLLAYVLRTSTGEGGVNLVQRAIFYLFLSVCMFIASSFIGSIDKAASRSLKLLLVIVIGCWIATTAFVYPLASYSHTSYSAIPYSEGAGIEFLGRITLDSKSVFTYRPKDFVLTTRTGELNLIKLSEEKNKLPENLEEIVERSIDVAVFQRGLYYYSSNQDLSFEDNAYTRVYDAVSQSRVMNKVYTNPSYDIFMKVSLEGS